MESSNYTMLRMNPKLRTLDYALYPHIVEAVVAYAPHDSLLGLRGTCTKLKRKADAILNRHVVYGPDSRTWRAWDTGITSDATDVRVIDVPEIGLAEMPFFMPNHKFVRLEKQGFCNTKLIRALPLSAEALEGITEDEAEVSSIRFDLPQGTAVRFIEYHRPYHPFPLLLGKAKTLVLGILYNPEEFPHSNRSFRCPFLQLDCDDVYILLIPEGQASTENRDEYIVSGPGFLSNIAWKLGMTIKWLTGITDTSRNITFVGAEGWEHHWMTSCITLSPIRENSSDDDGSCEAEEAVEEEAQTIEEGAPLDASVAERFKWWLFEIGSRYSWGDLNDVKKAVSFMTLDDFKATINDDEIFPLITSLNPHHKQQLD